MSGAHFDESYGAIPAENHERFFVPSIGGPLARRLIDRARVQPPERVLDVACGTGIVARLRSEVSGPEGDPPLAGVLGGRGGRPPDRFLDRFAGSRRFDYRWSAHPAHDGRPSHEMKEGPEILAQVAEADFPAAGYEIQAVLRLASIEDFETVRAFCGPKDQVFLSLASLRLSGRRQMNLDAVVDAAGYRIQGESRVPLDLAGVEELLGLRFSEGESRIRP